MLRVAVPNKGSLAEPASAMLREAGYPRRGHSKELTFTDHRNGVEFFFLRPLDIATYVGSGQLDVGITGRDLLLESGASAEEILALGFAGSVLHFAARPGTVGEVADLQGRTVATSYPGLVGKYLAGRGVNAVIVRLDGAVETAVELGVAEIVADVVETGVTLARAGLETIGAPILESEAVVIRGEGREDDQRVRLFLRRLRGVLVARGYVMVDYDIRVESVDKAVALTPGLESPTVSPLHNEGWVAVRAMVPRDDAHRVMDELWDIGARAILATDIHACRL